MPNAGVPIFKRKAVESASKIQRRYTIADVERQGFAQTGITYETTSEEVVLDYFRRWLMAPAGMKPFYGEKYQWEMMLARAGWIRPPAPWAEICERHKGAEVIKQELKQKQPVITKRRK